MPRSGSTGKQEQQGSVLQSSWEHRDRQLRTHMVVQALQNIGLDSTGCGGGRGAQTIRGGTRFTRPSKKKPLARGMSAWESLLFLLPGGID